ncbi:hypothetical protein TVAG_221920 [Trichomonas vaginalis G3]|uniref:DNA2/NAM7 helicase-like C-terminal domain-containing protein n=1 Tax=Trichomonas vaginalis (strain ATCC PRA-98 / G3) TaxID=412133 RepID=A2E3E7_TRIV3|nr:Nfx1-type zinc finger-containing protein family [Trichomonas vaginalis G3]EAY12838.1 hypothetical protein TVAG_221920 [Trichomonas vaginalis G3]KAI5488505.1 Nfx1-type zinc finger-containing protein family [Trichomonas vaginalis G3]|eukprot:XP_001325061.1 hypothetical protein [Trichomonas vaginalis G3]
MTDFSEEKDKMKNITEKVTNYTIMLSYLYEIAKKIDMYIKKPAQPLLNEIEFLLCKYIIPLTPHVDFKKFFILPFYPNVIKKNSKKMPKKSDFIKYWVHDTFMKEMKSLGKSLHIKVLDPKNEVLTMDYNEFRDKENDYDGDFLSDDINVEYLNIDLKFQSPQLVKPKPVEKKVKAKDDSDDDSEDASTDDDFTPADESLVDTGLLGLKDLSDEEILSMHDDLIDTYLNEALKKSREEPKERFKLMLKFIQQALTIITNQKDTCILQKETIAKMLDEEKNKAFGEYYKKFKVIGLTASYATMHRMAIEQCGCEFMIIEEAGELTEAITASFLGKSIKHLMMIGDFKQLRPKVDYLVRQEKNPMLSYDISPFERLVLAEQAKQGKDLFLLTVQRRMHPEISKLIREHFCPDIQDGPNVSNLPICSGLTNRVNFVLSNNFTEDSIATSRSKYNSNEADYAVALVFFFLFRGFSPKQISVITLYKGQAKNIRNKLKEYWMTKNKEREFDDYNPLLLSEQKIENVYVQCIDNYQGEENDVIIVATTRSEKIGFVKTENRALVTLSRAKCHLVVLGNETLLAKEESGIWNKIIASLDTLYINAKKPGIYIECPHEKVVLDTPNLLWEKRFGNCHRIIKIPLECGHTAIQYCSTKLLPCQKKCLKVCPGCKRQCGVVCFKCQQNGCPKCKKSVDYECTLHHKTTVECYQRQHVKAEIEKVLHNAGLIQVLDVEITPEVIQKFVDQLDPINQLRIENLKRSICWHQCDETLPCGHKCTANCNHIYNHEPHVCTALVDYTCETCNRSQKIKCGDKFKCRLDCLDILYCGHKCQGTCGDPCICRRRCDYIYPCGHKCTRFCSDKYDHQHLSCSVCELIYSHLESYDSNFKCETCGRICNDFFETKSCEHRCDKECDICKSKCCSCFGEKCVFCCDHDCKAKFPENETLFRPNNCNCVMTLKEAKEAIQAQFKSMTDPDLENPEQLTYLHCPNCDKPITNSWIFTKEIRIVNKLIKQRDEEAKKLLEFSESSSNEDYCRHLFKVVACSCGKVNFFDCSPTDANPKGEIFTYKCSCGKTYTFTKDDKKKKLVIEKKSNNKKGKKQLEKENQPKGNDSNDSNSSADQNPTPQKNEDQNGSKASNKSQNSNKTGQGEDQDQKPNSNQDKNGKGSKRKQQENLYAPYVPKQSNDEENSQKNQIDDSLPKESTSSEQEKDEGSSPQKNEQNKNGKGQKRKQQENLYAPYVPKQSNDNGDVRKDQIDEQPPKESSSSATQKQEQNKNGTGSKKKQKDNWFKEYIPSENKNEDSDGSNDISSSSQAKDQEQISKGNPQQNQNKSPKNPKKNKNFKAQEQKQIPPKKEDADSHDQKSQTGKTKNKNKEDLYKPYVPKETSQNDVVHEQNQNDMKSPKTQQNKQNKKKFGKKDGKQ